eukprot:2920372-Prymnesium_polylepis.2
MTPSQGLEGTSTCARRTRSHARAVAAAALSCLRATRGRACSWRARRPLAPCPCRARGLASTCRRRRRRRPPRRAWPSRAYPSQSWRRSVERAGEGGRG